MKRSMLLLASMGLAIVTAAPVTAAGPPGPTKTTATWTPAPAGPEAIWLPAAFAPTTCQLVTFGGTWDAGILASTALFDPGTGKWTTIAAKRTGPAARTLAQLAWDPTRQRVVMFGGRGGRLGVFQDTWAFDPSARTWAPLSTSCRKGTVCPPARWGHGMVWSSVLGKLLMFGGTVQQGDITIFDDLWTFGTTWTRISPVGQRPSPRFIFGMAEDAATGLIVVYGGVGLPAFTGLNDTWLFDPRTTTWTRVATPTQPPAYGEVAMGWSPSVGAVVMTGGDDGGCAAAADPGTWAFDMSAKDWVKLATTGGPPSPRKDATLTADTCRGTSILFGGEDGSLPPSFDDRTWILR